MERRRDVKKKRAQCKTTLRKRDERERERKREKARETRARCCCCCEEEEEEEEDMERRPPSDEVSGGNGKGFGSDGGRRRGNAGNTDDAGNTGDGGETVEVFGGDVWSSGAVLALVIAWMFKAATERCTC